MLYREIIAVCSQTHTKQMNALFVQNVELLNVKPCGVNIVTTVRYIWLPPGCRGLYNIKCLDPDLNMESVFAMWENELIFRQTLKMIGPKSWNVV